MVQIKDHYNNMEAFKASRTGDDFVEKMPTKIPAIASMKTTFLKANQILQGDTKSNAATISHDGTNVSIDQQNYFSHVAQSTAHSSSSALARFPNGTLGYIADPAALRKGIATFMSKEGLYRNEKNVTTLVSNNPRLYWKLLQEYEPHHRNDTYSGQEILSPDYTCSLGPGRGHEQDYGYRLLTEKIRIIRNDNNHKTRQPRILCLVYTHPKMRDLQRTQALSWGHQCNGYLAFSTETIPTLGLVHLEHEGDESYDNMWQKTRSIWTFVYQNYAHAYDFFHLGGDDLYVIVENMRKFLLNYMNRTDPVYLGQWIPLPGNDGAKYYVSGGPGYTLNRAALSRLVEDALPSCRVHMRASYEDRLVSQCFREIVNITGGDTRDVQTGQQLYHDVGPAHLYTFRSTTGRGSFHAKAAAYWETLPFPNNTVTVGPRHELEAAGTYSITFHDIYHPLYFARLHSILYKTCPSMSPLGRALEAQCTS